MSRKLVHVYVLKRYVSVTPSTRKKPSTAAAYSFDFDTEARTTLDAYKRAIDPLKHLNQSFDCNLTHEGNLVVKTVKGDFVLRPDHDKKVISLKSYVSGFHNYEFDRVEKQWVSIKDGHDMRGLITRDILRHCIGCPIFP